MKKFLGVITLLAIFMAGFCMQADAKKKRVGVASINFAEKVYDFGKISESGGAVTHEFDFTNEGDGNLVILSATAQCGCTRPSFPANPVSPGKKGKIKVSFNPAGREGDFEKTITVATNGNPHKIRLKIKGYIYK